MFGSMFNSEPSPDARRASSRDRDAKHRSRDRPKETPEERAARKERGAAVAAAAARERGQRRPSTAAIRSTTRGCSRRSRRPASHRRPPAAPAAPPPAEPAAGDLRVYLRAGPPARGRPREAGRPFGDDPTDGTMLLLPEGGGGGGEEFMFERCFAECVATSLFEAVGAPLLEQVRKHRHAAVLLYGARGSGKERAFAGALVDDDDGQPSTPQTRPSEARASLCRSAKR